MRYCQTAVAGGPLKRSLLKWDYSNSVQCMLSLRPTRAKAGIKRAQLACLTHHGVMRTFARACPSCT